jgi:hypothetical protein
MGVPRVEELCVEILRADEEVALGYLFGSQAASAAGPLSDVDVGVIFRAGTNVEIAHGELLDALVRALATDRVDLVVLDRAAPPLRYRVIRDGKLIHCIDEAIRVRFETDTVMRYLDFKPLRDRAFRWARKAILEGT